MSTDNGTNFYLNGLHGANKEWPSGNLFSILPVVVPHTDHKITQGKVKEHLQEPYIILIIRYSSENKDI